MGHVTNAYLLTQQHYSKNVKVDDDDGHYIVVPDAELTERCTLIHPSNHRPSPRNRNLMSSQIKSPDFSAKEPSARWYKREIENEIRLLQSRSSGRSKSTVTHQE